MEPGKRAKLAYESRDGVYIIHACDVKPDHDFTFIHNTKGRNEPFARLQEIKKLRQSQPLNSQYCSQLPDVCQDNHGYHRICYMRFTGNLQ